jgi:hypothetical protein
MPKGFAFYGGQGTDQGAVSQAIGSAVAAGSQAAAIKANAFGDVSRILAQGLQQAQERKLQERLEAERRKLAVESQQREFQQQATMQEGAQKFAGDQQRLEREQRASEFSANLKAGQERAQTDLLQSLGTAGMAAGLAPGPLMDTLLNLGSKALGIPPPGGPGGYMIEPPQDSGYKSLMKEKQGGTFADLPVTPQPLTSTQLQQQKSRAMDEAAMFATSYVLSPEGQKKTYVPLKRSYWQALRMDKMDPKQRDELVISMYPDARPVQGFDGKEEDRSGLDARIKWLKEPQEMQMLNEAAIQQGILSMTPQFGFEASKEALTHAIGDHPTRPVRNLRDAEQVADEYLLKQLGEMNQRPASRAVQGSAQDQLGAAVDRKQQGDTLGKLGQGGGGFRLTSEALSQLGLNADQLPRSIRSAVAAGSYELQPDPSGRFMVVAPASGVVDPGLQRDIDVAFNVPGRDAYQAARAFSELGPSEKKTPSEMKDAATLREMKAGGGAQPKASAPKPKQEAPEAPPPQAQTPASSALSKYRAKAQGARAPQPKGKSRAVPPSMSVLGRTLPRQQSLLQLLGIGGGRPR